MTIIEYIKKEHANIKEKPKEERWRYFWDYYKWHVLAVVLAVVLLTQTVVGIINRKEVVFSGILLNCIINVNDDQFLQDFYDFAGIDSRSQEAAFYTDLILTEKNTKSDVTVFQRIMAGAATKETDFVVGQPENFPMCAYSTARILMDLRTLLDEDTISRLSDRLYYIDGAVLEKLSAPVGETIDADIAIPDPTKPEAMEDPIPVGIDVSDLTDFQTAYYFPDTTLYLGIISNTSRPELAKQFINFLFS